ncbi:MAG: MipA/OmpV family protein [Woeseiaceae bacterium]|nr:MipA/OmpV family protein [Woeseiaceae bacterium]
MRGSNVGKRLLRAAAIFALVGAMPAHAQYEVAEIPFFNTPSGTAALGGGIRLGTDPYLAFDDTSDSRQFDLVPLYLYNGKYLFFRGTAGGVHLFKNDNFQFNLLGRYRFQELDPDRNAFYAGLEERRQTVDAGLEARFRGRYGALNLNYLTDTLGRHKGQSAEISYRYTFDRGTLSFSPFVSWAWNSDKLTNYYFGVSEAESRPDLPVYAPGESQSVSFGMNTTWWVTDRIQFFGNLGFTGLDTRVTNSPLVDEDVSSAFFAGGTYIFGNVRKPESFISSERAGEWSWRLNYGYQADGNIVSEIDQGDFSKSSFADTNIGGVTFGKLLTNGRRVDFTGKLALFRHFEEDEGNGNFWSYALYMMATGRGYSPWSNQEVFRYGFGFGMSYADKVPIAEQRKQAASGNNTSRFLNYLELQLDFPLRRLFKARSIQECYAGVTVVHRSGIFGTSDFLGDVAGGSDWITAHFECAMGRKR